MFLINFMILSDELHSYLDAFNDISRYEDNSQTPCSFFEFCGSLKNIVNNNNYIYSFI